MILAVDIGASKAKAGSFSLNDGALRLDGVKRYLTKEWSDLTSLLKAHLASERQRDSAMKLDAIAIGIAGPVTGSVGRLTNLPWVVDSAAIRRETPCQHVYLMNDLVAHGYGTLSLGPDDVTTLQHGLERPGNRAVIAAGSGLGECIMVEADGSYLALPSEGGHADFSPRNEEEIRLLTFLLRRYPEHVSWERVVSGKYGFRNLVDFFLAAEPQLIGAELKQQVEGVQEVGPVITDAANSGDGGAAKILNLFARLYGSEAGNLALQAVPLGGLYISGGVARRILPWLSSGHFMDAFVAKGRMHPLLRKIPVHVVTDPESAIKGLAHYAYLQLSASRHSNLHISTRRVLQDDTNGYPKSSS